MKRDPNSGYGGNRPKALTQKGMELSMVEKQILSGSWRLLEVDTGFVTECAVPCEAGKHYRDIKRLPDPFFGTDEGYYNELALRDYEYSCSFEVSADKLSFDRVTFVAEGLDTFADVYVNGQKILKTDNMFVAYSKEIGSVLKAGENTVKIYFHSPYKEIEKLSKLVSVPLEASVHPLRSHARKAQYSFGWDWGPRIPNTGIWRPVYIEYVNKARLHDVCARTKSIGESGAVLTVGGVADIYNGGEYTAGIELLYDGQTVAKATAPVANRAFETELLVAFPRLWYPNGSGEPELYEVRVNLMCGESCDDTVSFMTGIRTVRLLREPDEAGESFIFEINGRKIFAKGANWIPGDSFLTDMTRERYETLLIEAKDAHMNMLRVWGGGVYEDENFYDLCDRLGIMVWQDFMYACAEYPDELADFRDMAEEEARKAVKLLRNHASIVLWCGNNEVTWGFDDWWGKGDPEYLGNKVFKEILPRVCEELDPTCPYWVGSPSGGPNNNCETHGDRHSWLVWSDGKEYADYDNDRCRFMSEFGFQAMPCLKTVHGYVPENERRISSPSVKSHNKQKGGMKRLETYLASNVGYARDFDSFVYLTQFVQAEAIKYGVEHWRSIKFHNAGTLFWQFNDCWPVASWACVDYYGRRKPLYHYAKTFFAPVSSCIRHNGPELDITLINDLEQAVEAEIRISLYRLGGGKLGETVKKVTIPQNGNLTLEPLSVRDLGLPEQLAMMPVDGDVAVFPEMTDVSLLGAVVFMEIIYGGQSVSNYHLFSPVSGLVLTKPEFSVTRSGNEVTVISDKPAFGVFLETENDVKENSNCLWMEPGKTYTVSFDGDPGEIVIQDITRLRKGKI